ncbi:MAG TPA: [LysW]-lysine hydrolase [Myxococcota bacterium]|nr:[LysW]-lysine hydrolase [Myxococcota bacterium]
MTAPTEETALLREIVEIDSPSGAEEAVSRHLVQRMQSWGFRAERDAAGNAVGEVGEADAESPVVLLLGHIDTVPGHVPVREEDGVLWGRGAVDAKGPFAAFVCAARRAAEAGVLRGKRVVCVGAVEEEAPTSRGARHVAPRWRPRACVIGEPSGADAVTLGYKGRLLLHYRRRGATVHGAAREQGVPDQAFAFYRRVVERAEAHSAGKAVFDRLDARLLSLEHERDGLHEEVRLAVSLRLPLDVAPAALAAELRALDAGAEVRDDGAEVAYRADKNTPLVRAFLRAIRAAGGTPSFKLKTGTSDMNVVGPVWRCPILAYGPGDSSLDHTPEERLPLAEFGRAVDVLAAVLAEI